MKFFFLYLIYLTINGLNLHREIIQHDINSLKDKNERSIVIRAGLTTAKIVVLNRSFTNDC